MLKKVQSFNQYSSTPKTKIDSVKKGIDFFNFDYYTVQDIVKGKIVGGDLKALKDISTIKPSSSEQIDTLEGIIASIIDNSVLSRDKEIADILVKLKLIVKKNKGATM